VAAEPFCQSTGTRGRRNRPDGLGCGLLIEGDWSRIGRVSHLVWHGDLTLGDLVGYVDQGKVDAGVDKFLQLLFLGQRDYRVAAACWADNPVCVLSGICPVLGKYLGDAEVFDVNARPAGGLDQSRAVAFEGCDAPNGPCGESAGRLA
jgi:hypothetical protein